MAPPYIFNINNSYLKIKLFIKMLLLFNKKQIIIINAIITIKEEFL